MRKPHWSLDARNFKKIGAHVRDLASPLDLKPESDDDETLERTLLFGREGVRGIDGFGGSQI